jgi:hypothetical protein
MCRLVMPRDSHAALLFDQVDDFVFGHLLKVFSRDPEIHLGRNVSEKKNPQEFPLEGLSPIPTNNSLIHQDWSVVKPFPFNGTTDAGTREAR